MEEECAKVSPLLLGEEEVVIMYSANHFEVYADNFERVYPFDNLTEGSIFLFQKLVHPVYLFNPEHSPIMISKQKVGSPLNPLQLNEE